MTDTEVMTVWATDPAGHEALGRAIDAGTDERIAALARHARASTSPGGARSS